MIPAGSRPSVARWILDNLTIPNVITLGAAAAALYGIISGRVPLSTDLALLFGGSAAQIPPK